MAPSQNEESQKYKTFLADLIFPRFCLGCDKILKDETGEYVCPECISSIKLESSFACAFCNAPVVAGKTCPFCIKDHYLDRLLVSSSYKTPLVETIIKSLKYRFVSILGKTAGDVMSTFVKEKIFKNQIVRLHSPVIVPVPLHHGRLRWRGFNQSELIADKISENTGWPIWKNVLKRTKSTPPQANIRNRADRIKIMNGIFDSEHSQQDLDQKDIVLVDDVTTTSSTLNDCARSLKAKGAREIIGFVFARNI